MPSEQRTDEPSAAPEATTANRPRSSGLAALIGPASRWAADGSGWAILGLRRRPSGFSVAVAVAAVWAAVADLARLGFGGSAFDERLYAIAAWRYVHGDTGAPAAGTRSNYDNFEHPPLAKYLFGLAQLVAGHPSVVADRVVAALCTLAASVVLGLWLAAAAGRWVGLAAGTLLAVVPMSVPVADVVFRFGRYGFLDPVAELFSVGALALSWFWSRREGRSGWVFAAATGACVGLAAASKENGFLGAIGPVVVGVALSGRRRRPVLVRALQALAAAAVSGAVFVLSYAGLADPGAAVAFLVRFQREHAQLGHRVVVAGHATTHPSGWAFLWFAQHGLGVVVTISCLVGVAAAVALRRDRLVLWCVAALVGPLIFHMGVARVVLPFYWVMWTPAFIALAVLGLAALSGEADAVHRARRRAGPLLAVLCAVGLAGASLHDTYRMLTRAQPHRPSYATQVARDTPLAYLRLDDRAGTVATDSSGNDFRGVYRGGPGLGAPGLIVGDTDTAVHLDGTDQFVTVPGAAWMNAADYTVAVWFRSSAAGGYLVARDDYVSKVWNLSLDRAGRLSFVTYSSFGGHGQALTTPARYADGRTHLAVAVKRGTTMRLYVDGRPTGSTTFATYASSPTVELDIGRRGNGTGLFAGTVDDVAYFGRALPGSEVAALYRAARPSAGR